MYLIGHHGNNLYTSSLRLFTDIDLVFEYMDKRRLSGRRKNSSEHVQRITKDLPTYINSMGYKYFQLNPNKDQDTETINKRKMAKLAKKWVESRVGDKNDR
jgi:hypothetical protein